MDLILKSEILEVKQRLLAMVIDIQSCEYQRNLNKLGERVEVVLKLLYEIEPK